MRNGPTKKNCREGRFGRPIFVIVTESELGDFWVSGYLAVASSKHLASAFEW